MNTANYTKRIVQKINVKNLQFLEEEKSQKIVTLTLTLLLVCVFLIFAILPTAKTIATLNKDISDREYISNNLQTKIINLNALHENYLTIGADLPLINASIPQDPKTTYLVGQLQKIAEDNSLSINSITVNQVDIKNSANTTTNGSFSFSADVVGSASQIEGFLKELGAFSRIITFDSLVYTKNVNDSNFELVLQAKAYMKP